MKKCALFSKVLVLRTGCFNQPAPHLRRWLVEWPLFISQSELSTGANKMVSMISKSSVLKDCE